MIGVVIVPTGIGAEIGGHAGDANPVVKLVAECCDKVITHPNVVNASDINEMPDNVLYVEGSLLDRFLDGEFHLKQPRQNKILVVVNKPVREDTINAVSAARVTIGIDVEIMELNYPLTMKGFINSDNKATGHVGGHFELLQQIQNHSFDALAIHTPIDISRDVALKYYREGGVNPWGGVEALASKMIAERLNKPVAHAPLESVTIEDEELFLIFNERIDPRISPEAISNCYLHCVLKGLNKAPRISISGIHINNVDFMLSPYGCYGTPHMHCLKNNIPVIMVKENKTVLNKPYPNNDNLIIVENYWEAIGVIMAMKVGIDRKSVRRPLEKTKVLKGN